MKAHLLSLALVVMAAAPVSAQPDPQYKIHDWSRPRPPVVDPGTPGTPDRPGNAPSDATVLFDGKDLGAWASMDGSAPKWIVKDGVMECVQGSGYIRTRQNFGDCQLHIEWSAPAPPRGASQGRGNSGVFLMGIYEVQVLDCWENQTYADGQAGAVYAQYPPLVNASRPPGQWQTYDIIFTRPRFDAEGKLVSPAFMTVLHNGVLVQNHVTLTGPTSWMSRAPYKAHPDKLPISLQDHGNPVRYRNLWIRELSDASQKEFTYSPALLDRCAGDYFCEDGLKLAVTRTNSLLLLTIGAPREHRHLFYAASPSSFFARDVDAHLDFQTNAQGAAESVSFWIAGETRKARRGETR